MTTALTLTTGRRPDGTPVLTADRRDRHEQRRRLRGRPRPAP